jgi:hypothetical protein
VVRTGRRERGRGGSRILYWFRTPPGVRVGRTPLDQETIREIEAQHPEIRFDWRQILKGEEEAPEERMDEEAGSAAYAQLGPEGLARLRTRYGQVVAGIQRRVADPGSRDRLLREAERLNPDRWASPDEVKRALEEYEAIHESLRSVVVGSVRRRKRRPRGETPDEEARSNEPRTDEPPGEPTQD